jgi:hypothetical protein
MQMKKILLTIVAVVFGISVFAQKGEEIKKSELPKNITTWISQNFKKPSIERAAKVTDNKNLLGYCVSVDTKGRKTILVFDKNGKYLEKVQKVADAQNVLKPAQPQPTPPVKK